jgi:hypothetical protein
MNHGLLLVTATDAVRLAFRKEIEKLTPDQLREELSAYADHDDYPESDVREWSDNVFTALLIVELRAEEKFRERMRGR